MNNIGREKMIGLFKKKVVAGIMSLALAVSGVFSGFGNTALSTVNAEEAQFKLAGIYVSTKDYGNCVYHDGLECEAVYKGDNLEFRWTAEKDGSTAVIKDWSSDSKLSYTPDTFGTYKVKCEARMVVGDAKDTDLLISVDEDYVATATDAIIATVTDSNYDYTQYSDIVSKEILYKYCPYITATCQISNPNGDGFLVGIQTKDNNNYKYEMSVLDLNQYNAGLDAWIYSTGKFTTSSNTAWAVWQPKYGVFWVLFRVYDANDTMIDQYVYSFVYTEGACYSVDDENSSLSSPNYYKYSEVAKTATIKAEYNMSAGDWEMKEGKSLVFGVANSLREIQGIKLTITNTDCPGGITYQTCITGRGWQPERSNGESSGDLTGYGINEQFKFSLTGEIAEYYDIYYRAQVENLGWQGWTCNNQPCGSDNYYKAVQAVEIKLVEKGENPGVTLGNAVIKPATEGDYKCAMYAKQVIKSVTNSKMTQIQKLKACYDWCVKGNYVGIFENVTEGYTREQWYACIFFEKRTGNCFAYSSAFCQMAKVLGYNAKEVFGYLIYSDGSHRPHGWVEIDGKIYDPQIEWRRGYDCFGKRHLRYSYD